MKWLFAILLFALTGTAFADQNIGTGTSWFFQQESFLAGSGCITTGASSDCMVFPAHQQTEWVIVVQNEAASTAANCAWVGFATLALATDGSVGATAFTGGQAPGFGLPAQGSRMDDSPVAADLITAQRSGMEDGFCELPITQLGIESFVPCRVAGGGTNCAAFNSLNLGICTPPRRRQLTRAGLMLVCNGDIGVTLQKMKV